MHVQTFPMIVGTSFVHDFWEGLLQKYSMCIFYMLHASMGLLNTFMGLLNPCMG